MRIAKSLIAIALTVGTTVGVLWLTSPLAQVMVAKWVPTDEQAAPPSVSPRQAMQRPATVGEKEIALSSAAATGDPATVRDLAEVAAGDSMWRNHAARAIGTISSDRAAEELVKMARGPAPVLVRANAIRALGNLRRPEDASSLLEMAVNVHEPLRIRQESCRAIAHNADGEAVAPLAQALQTAMADASSSSEQLRISLIQSLRGIDSPAAREVLLQYSSRNLPATERAYLQAALRGL